VFSRLYSHHPKKKAIKKVIDRRPLKRRPSDINRRNRNLNVCITKIPEFKETPDFIIVTEERKSQSVVTLLVFILIVVEYLNDKDELWENLERGDPNATWHSLEDTEVTREWEASKVRVSNAELKHAHKHPLIKSRSPKTYPHLGKSYSNKTLARIARFESQLIHITNISEPIPLRPNNFSSPRLNIYP
jgi:hypothetical protein